MTGCDGVALPDDRLTLDAYDGLRADQYALNSQKIRENLEHICHADKDRAPADFNARKYYEKGGSLVWTSLMTLDDRADTLLEVLRRELPAMGFSERAFSVADIESDMQRMRNLSFDEDNPVNKVVARLEYNLTKAYLRYVTGQRFGFVDPTIVLNHLDPSKTDSTGRVLGYTPLYDVEVEHAGDYYTEHALSKVRKDTLGRYLEQVKPKDAVYNRLLGKLSSSSEPYRTKLIVNMERRRWREKQQVPVNSKYVLVNIAAFHLWAVGPDSVTDMRIACGALKTKTPLLSSSITHMQVNPEWSIPMSIIRNDVARHAGNSSYFSRHRYYIADRNGKCVSPESVTQGQLLSGNYRIAQEGGAGNALGSIIFRFQNKFSVFLHYTSNPSVFNSENRGVSHGCVRVQHPFELARFLLGNTVDDWTLDKLRISMRLNPETPKGIDYVSKATDKNNLRLINSLQVTPHVPVFITYYTVFQNPSTGELDSYPDVYGYDKVIEQALKTYMK